MQGQNFGQNQKENITEQQFKRYQAPSKYISDQYYKVDQIVEFQNGTYKIELNEINQLEKAPQLHSHYSTVWMEHQTELEIELLAILYERAIFATDITTYITKRVHPFLDQIICKSNGNQDKLKIICYSNELLLLIQAICFKIFKQYPLISLGLLKKIHTNLIQLYDSQQKELSKYVENFENFYGERLHYGLKFQAFSYIRQYYTEPYNSRTYYPLQLEMLDENELQVDVYRFSPYQRMQLHYFYQQGGLSLLNYIFNNFSLNYIEIFEFLPYIIQHMNKTQFKILFFNFDPIKLINSISEDEIKNSNRETLKKIPDGLEKIIIEINCGQLQKQQIALTEMNLNLQCFRNTSLEKRIYGLQQFCEKINSAVQNEFMHNISYDWYSTKNILEFLISHNVFEELVGQSTHFELIKRSQPIIQFLYSQKQLGQNHVLSILKLGQGKHETWTHVISTLLSDLGEMLTLEDIEVMLNFIQQQNLIDQNILNFLKSLGRNRYLRTSLQQQCGIKRISQNVCNVRIPGKRKYQEYQNQDEYNEGQVLQVGEIQEEIQQTEPVIQPPTNEETQITIIKSKIVGFLLDFVHVQPKTELGRLSFQIAQNMICTQFKGLRVQYLMFCFDQLFGNDPKLPIDDYTTLIQKIIQSNFPIDNFVKFQNFLEWIELTYQFKYKFLKVLAQEKIKNLKQPLNFLSQCENLIKFYQFIYQDQQIGEQQLEILWKLFVINAACQEERNLFFTWLGENNKLNQKFLTQEATLQLFLLIIKCQTLSIPMFQCLTNLIVYFNIQYQILKYHYDEYRLQDSEILGIQVIWNIFFNQKQLNKQVQDFLIQLLKYKQNTQIQNQMKYKYLEQLFKNIEHENSLPFIVRLLEEFEGYVVNDLQSEKIIITIDNKCIDALPPKRQDIYINTTATVLQAKQIIGQKLNPQLKPDEFDIMCRGTLFDNLKTLQYYKVNSKLTFVISKKEIIADQLITDEFQAYANQNYGEPDNIEEKLTQIQEITEVQDREILRLFLKDKNWNEENVITEIIENGTSVLQQYQNQSQIQKQQKKNQQQSNEISFATLISTKYINSLFEVLTDYNRQLVWSILQMIPRNQQIYELIELSQTEGDWTWMLKKDNIYKLQYNLQILKEQLVCDFIEDQNEYNKRKQLRENFLNQNGVKYLLKLLNQNYNSDILLLILDIFNIYFIQYALGKNYNNQKFIMIKQAVQKLQNDDNNTLNILLEWQTNIEKPLLFGFDEASLLQTSFFTDSLQLDIDYGFLFSILMDKGCYEQVYTILLLLLSLYEIKNVNFKSFFINLQNPQEEKRKLVALFLYTAQSILIEKGDIISSQRMLQNLIQESNIKYDEIYQLISALIENNIDVDIPINELFIKSKEVIINRPIIEERFQENEDKLIQGNLLFLTSLLKKDKTLCPNEQFTQYLYELLFDMHDDYCLYPVYKRKLTRKRAFSLLLECCQSEKNLLTILPLLEQNHMDDVDIESGVKGIHGFVGLRNLGATCYINSLLQQFFMIKQLRQGLLISEGGQVVKSLQYVFAELQDSVKQFINPNNLINSIQGFNGEIINVLVQQDCNEFFNLITDRLESELKGTQQNQLIQQVFEGQLAHEIKSLQQNYVFERETNEPFLTVSIEIKNKKNLEEALDFFVKADILDGVNQYFCEEIARKIDVQKRCYFKKLPNIFVFNLKRFEYDFNTMVRIKVNDYFEFPLEIDLYKWTKDYLTNQIIITDHSEYMYKLKGIVIHMGNAEGGHYLSLIRDGDNWFEFNDKDIKQFNINNLKYECFGGANQNKNAYMLFYEKCKPYQFIEIENNNNNLTKQIIDNNNKYLKNQLFYAQDYLNFIQKLALLLKIQQPFPITQLLSKQGKVGSLYDLETRPSLQLIRLFTAFTFETMIKNKNQYRFIENQKQLSDMLKKEPASHFWFLLYLTQQKQYFIDLLIESSFIDVRQSFSFLIIQAIDFVSKIEINYIDDESITSKFLYFYISELFPIIKNTLRRSVDYFQILRSTILCNQQIVRHFYDKQYFSQIYNLYIEQLNIHQQRNVFKLYTLNQSGIDQTIIIMADIISKVILSSRTQAMQQYKQDSPYYLYTGQQYFDIDQYWVQNIIKTENITKYIIGVVQLQNSLLDVIKHICWKDIIISEQIIYAIIQLIVGLFIEYPQTEQISIILEGLLRMEDDFQYQRVELLFNIQIKDLYLFKGNSVIEAIHKTYQNDINYMFSLVEMIAILSQIPCVSQYINEKRDQFIFILDYTRSYRNMSYGLLFSIGKIIRSLSQLAAVFNEPEFPPDQNPVIHVLQEEPEEENDICNMIDQNKQQYNDGFGLGLDKDGSMSNHASEQDEQTEELGSNQDNSIFQQ